MLIRDTNHNRPAQMFNMEPPKPEEPQLPDKATYYLNHEEEACALMFRQEPALARLHAMERNIDIDNTIQKYAIREALNSWKLGVNQGKDEAEGKSAAPGALKLAWWKARYGTPFILGRQHALGNEGKHGGSKSNASIINEILKDVKKDPEKFIKALTAI